MEQPGYNYTFTTADLVIELGVLGRFLTVLGSRMNRCRAWPELIITVNHYRS